MSLHRIHRSQALSLLTNFSTSYRRHDSTIDPYSLSKKLSNLFKSGQITEAEKVFDQMPQRNVVSWSIAIYGYAINGLHQKGLATFSQMRDLGLAPNSFTVVGVLLAVAGLHDVKLAKCAHGLVLKTGLFSDLIVGTAILDTYGKCGFVFDSYRMFEELKKPGLVSCNAVVSGFMNNGFWEDGFLLFEKFRKLGFMPNAVTMLSLMKGCVGLERRLLCDVVYGFFIKLGFGVDIAVANAVLDMFSSFMDLGAAVKVFDDMECKDVISWTTMMGLLVDLECGLDALKLTVKMRNSHINYDDWVIMHLLSACSMLGDLERGKQVHAQAVIFGVGSQVPHANSIIAMYSKGGDLRSSKVMFCQIKEKNIASWTAIISGCVQNGQPMLALDFVIKAIEELNHSLDAVIFVTVLSAAAELAALDFCQQVHCYALVLGLCNYRSVQNSLITTYSKCGTVDIAHIVFNEMGYLKDIVSWNAIMSGYGINGLGEKAVSLYLEMRKSGEEPDSASYLCVLNACCHAGLVTDGLIIFNQMVEEGNVRPSPEHYGCAIDMLVRAGCLSDAAELPDKVLEEMGPNSCKALLSGCVLHGNIELAEVVAKKLFEQDKGEPGQLVLLSNAYVSVGRFQEAEALRLRINEKGFVKSPGISLLSGISYDGG